jgi:hypothetical protein
MQKKFRKYVSEGAQICISRLMNVIAISEQFVVGLAPEASSDGAHNHFERRSNFCRNARYGTETKKGIGDQPSSC